MVIQLPKKVKKILDKLQVNGYEAYAVGGCVRDTILGRNPKDWDITTSATPEQMKVVFSRTIDTGIEHGTVTVMIGTEGFEVTTYRIDGEYEDARHPKEVIYTRNLLDDLKRRDFTMNTMAYNEQVGLVDKFDGLEDLKRGMIRCVGNPKERFSEDALRILRAIRFAAQLGFTIEDETKKAITTLAPNLIKVSAERIQVELIKLVTSDYPQEMKTLYETGVSQVILPEWDKMMETTQQNPHHSYTVGEHSIKAMLEVPEDKVLRLTMLLHDVAKPECKTVDDEGIDHFYGHPKRGQEMAKEILRRLKFDNATMNKVCHLIRWHDCNPILTKKSIRHAIFEIGIEQFPDIFVVKKADVLAQSQYMRTEKMAYLNEYQHIYEEILREQQCLSLKDLAVTGSDLIQAGMKPGKQIGETLHTLLEIVLNEPEKNTKEYLLGYTLHNLFI